MKCMYSSFQCRLLSLVSFLTLRRTRKFIPPPWYKVPRRLSLDENVRAKEGGKETTDETLLRLPFVPCPWSLAVHYQSLAITLRKTKRLRRRRLREGGGWWMEPLPEVFGMLQYFETILPSVESL